MGIYTIDLKGVTVEIDRAHQREILEWLKIAYPRTMPMGQLEKLRQSDTEGIISEKIIASVHDIDLAYLEVNVEYLIGHGLVEKVRKQATGPADLRITVKGIDFLLDDGGLSAILGVVTVRLHDDTIKGLIEAKILASDLPEEKKRSLLKRLADLKGKALERVTEKFIGVGAETVIAHAGDAWDAIEQVLLGG